jgi:hypothetical protein
VAARTKAWVCGRSLARIAGSSPAWSLDVYLLGVLCVLSGRGFCDGSIARPEESYRMWCVYLSVISKLQRCGGLGPLWLSSHEKKTYVNLSCGIMQVWMINKFLYSETSEYSHDWVFFLDNNLPHDTTIAENGVFLFVKYIQLNISFL